MPQARDSGSSPSLSGAAKLSQVAARGSEVRRSISARQSSSSLLIAGCTSDGAMASKRGRPVETRQAGKIE